MLAYKFLEGGRSPFTGWRWEQPGGLSPAPWLSVSGPLGLCENGVHACAPRHLPLWVNDELWEMELAGEVVETEVAFVASKGRLLGRVHAWDPTMQASFSEYCAARARQLAGGQGEPSPLVAAIGAMAASARAAAAGYWSAVLAGETAAGRRSGPDYERAFTAERAARAGWLTKELSLAG
jgi:hypothetical protein